MRGFKPCPTCPDPRACSAAGVCLKEAEAAAGAAPPPPAPGGAPMGMKKGGAVKKSGRKKYMSGGAVRGAGKAKKGVRKCKMY